MLHLGDPLPVAVFAMLMSAVAAARSHWRLALVALVGPGLTAISGALLKPLIARDFLGFLAFPSGHASAATALGLVAALVLASLLRLGPAGGTVLVAVGVIVSGGTMAVAVVTHRWHYPTDALGGICMAITLVLGSALLIEYLAERQPRR
jgi:undecaprenyl-diphosphatase